jgi:release factor glutamine methyltransferase
MAGTSPAMTGIDAAAREFSPSQPVSLGEAASAAARIFRKAGIETPELDARVLLCHAAGISHEAYVSDAKASLAPEAAARFEANVERRLAGEPVSRIIGAREFYGRRFRIDRSTLDPRPDTETLIDATLAIVDQKASRDTELRLLDLGTGSGAILVTLLAELPRATGVGTDISLAALHLAKSNAVALGVGGRASFAATDWLTGIGGAFDLVVANPPYLATAAIGALSMEVRSHDPFRALDGGLDGLSAYRSIAASARSALKPGGSLLVEIGPDQAEAVTSLLREAGLVIDEKNCLWRDLGGRPRVVMAQA